MLCPCRASIHRPHAVSSRLVLFGFNRYRYRLWSLVELNCWFMEIGFFTTILPFVRTCSHTRLTLTEDGGVLASRPVCLVSVWDCTRCPSVARFLRESLIDFGCGRFARRPPLLERDACSGFARAYARRHSTAYIRTHGGWQIT